MLYAWELVLYPVLDLSLQLCKQLNFRQIPTSISGRSLSPPPMTETKDPLIALRLWIAINASFLWIHHSTR
jgi:hypothetical protein